MNQWPLSTEKMAVKICNMTLVAANHQPFGKFSFSFCTWLLSSDIKNQQDNLRSDTVLIWGIPATALSKSHFLKWMKVVESQLGNSCENFDPQTHCQPSNSNFRSNWTNNLRIALVDFYCSHLQMTFKIGNVRLKWTF